MTHSEANGCAYNLTMELIKSGRAAAFDPKISGTPAEQYAEYVKTFHSIRYEHFKTISTSTTK
jgi:hypothetical protein